MRKNETRKGGRRELVLVGEREARAQRVKNWVLAPSRIRGLRFLRDAAVVGLWVTGHQEIAGSVRMGWTVLSILLGPHARAYYRAAWRYTVRTARKMMAEIRRAWKAIQVGTHVVVNVLRKAAWWMRAIIAGRR